jgi:hypothetical protein
MIIIDDNVYLLILLIYIYVCIDFVNVYGECKQPAECVDPCTCGPCSHLQTAQYSLHSGPITETTAPASYQVNDACPVKNTPNTCAAVCAQQAVGASPPSPNSNSSTNKTLSSGAVAGIVIGVLVFVAIVAALIYFFFIRNGLTVSDDVYM